MTPWTLSISGQAANYGRLTLYFPVEGGDGLEIDRNSIGNFHSGVHPGVTGMPYGSTDLTLVSSVTAEFPYLSFTPASIGLTDVTVSNGTDTMTFRAYWPEMIDLAYCLMPTYYLDNGPVYQATEATVTLGLARWETWRGMQTARYEVSGAATRNQNFKVAMARPDITNGPQVMAWQPAQAMTEMHDGGYSWWSYVGDAYDNLDGNLYSRKPVRIDASAVTYAANPFGNEDMFSYPGWLQLGCERNIIPKLARNGRNLVSIGWDEGWLVDGFTGNRVVEATMSASWDVTSLNDGAYAIWVYEPVGLTLYRWLPNSGTASVIRTADALPNAKRLTATRNGSELMAWYVASDGLHCTGGYSLPANKSLQYGIYELPQGDYLLAAKWWENTTAWSNDIPTWTDVNSLYNGLLVTPRYALLRTDGKTADVIESYSDSSNNTTWYSTARYHGL